MTSAQSVSAGANLWKNYDAQDNPTGKGCEGCHGATPSGARANAALKSNASSTNRDRAIGVLNNAITNSGSMSQYADGGSKDLMGTEKDSLLLYLESVFNTDPKTATTSFETAKNIDLGDDVSLSGNVAGITTLILGANLPNHGSVSFNNSLKRITYTPNNGWVGDDTFTYRARNSGDTYSTAERTVTVTTNPPPIPNITSGNSVNAKVGDFFTYTIVATNNPTSFDAGNLPAGLNRNGATISGTPITADMSHTATITASNAGGDKTENLVFNIAKGDPSLVLPDQTPNSQPFRPGTTFSIDPVTTQESPAALTYTVSPSSNCTNSGLTVTKVSTGSCTITVSQGSTSNWNAPLNKSKSVTITPAVQFLSFPAQVPATYVFVDGNTFQIDPATSNAATSSGNPIVYGSTDANICTVSGTTVTMQGAGTCTLTANQAGNADYAAAPQVTQNVILTAGEPGPPVVTAAIGGDTRASIVFTPPPNPGSPVTTYTGTCSIGGTSPKTGTASNYPVIVTGLTNGAPYSCNVTATNAIGTSVVSNTFNVSPLPSATATIPVIRSAGSVTFTIGTSSTFRIASTGTPNASISLTGTLPTGITASAFNTAGTKTISGTPASGTAGSYVISVTATNGSGTDTQSFRINIVKAPQTVTFAALADRAFSPTPFNVTASASSGLAVTFSSQSLGICTVTSGGAVTMLAVGPCIIKAIQAGDGTYLAANATQSFEISQASQSISWGTLPNKTFVAGGTFTLSPLASASSGLPITYTSLLPANCTVSGTTVTMVQVGACNIEAAQDGDANYLPASDFIRGFSINKAAQVITFPSQAAQPFVDGGTFAINPPATGGPSGNPIVYSSLSLPACTLSGSTVTMLSTGTCTIAANQAGNNNYLAAVQASVPIEINVAPPGAPTAQTATPIDAGASIDFLPPSTDGGSPLVGYRITCNPGGVVANGTASPLTVPGLANGVSHACTVAARNTAAFGAESNVVSVTPVLRSGIALWTNTCSGCHGEFPSAARFNAAGDTGTVLAYVRLNQATMLANAGVQSLTNNELSEIAKYIKTFVPAINVNTEYVTPKMIDVGLPNHLYLGGVAFTDAEVVTPPANGTMSVFNGTLITYTPNAGFAGTDSFTYRGKRTSPQLVQGEARTVTIMVNTPAAPVITSGIAANGVFGQPFGYQITATNSPASFGATGLPPGVTVNTASGLIGGTPTSAGPFNAVVSATNPGGTGQLTVAITVSAANQTITFGAQGSQLFVPGGMFAINPLASASSGLSVSYSTTTPGVCTVSGTTVTIVTAGTCAVAANQGGNGNFNAALPVSQNIAINAVAPVPPLIGTATPGNGTATIAFSAPPNNGGSPITQYNATCSPGGAGSNTVSPIVISSLANNTQYSCSVTATNAAGTSGPSGTVMVTPVMADVPPQFTSANATTFTVLTPNTFNVTASGTPAPTLTLQSGAPPMGVSFVSGVLSGTPASGTAAGSPYNLVFLADGTNPDATQNFTLTVAKQNQIITFNNPGAQNFSVSAIPLTPPTATLPVTLVSNTPAACTVSGNNLTTVTTGVCSLTASQTGNADVNAATSVTNVFQINAAPQSITFGAQTSPRNFSATPFVLSPVAFATSGLPIAYATTTPSVCTANGTSITTLTAGTCTIAANQGGNQNFAAATQVTQNVVINPIAPSAPTIGAASGSDQSATINFTAPLSNGGSPITQFTATCSPSGSASGNASPIVVTGLTNGQSYMCSVTATNMAGFTSPASGTVNVTPTSANGAALWTSVCGLCHSQTPSGNQLNGAGSTATVLQHVRSTQTLMSIFPAVQNLTQSDLAAIAVYIRDQLPANNVSTPQNTAVPINVNGHITFTNQSWSAFTSVEVVTPPVNGVLSAFTGTTAIYTPNNGFTGTDSFTYRGKRTAPDVLGDAIQITITVQPGAPVITSSLSANGTFNAPFSYQIAASGSPTSFGATGLPNGFSVNAAGLISGTPNATGMFTVGISATNAGGTANANLVITVGPAAQSISFPAQTIASRNYVQSGSFAINPVATGGASGQPVTYGSASPSVCTVSGTTVNIVFAGTCTLTANQAGDANYAAAPQVTQAVSINPVSASAPTIGVATPGNMSGSVSFTAPSDTGGSSILSYSVICGPSGSGSGPASPIVVTGLTNGVAYECIVAAITSFGAGAFSQPVIFTPQQITVPSPPVIGVPAGLNNAASIGFGAPVNNGGSAILSYTAICNPGMFSNTGTASPVVVSGLTNGNTYSCSVIATNAIGASAPSGSMDVTPFSPVTLDRVVSRKLHGAVVGEVTLNAEPIGGNIAIEPRLGNSGHRIVFVFTGSLGGNPGTVMVTDAFGTPMNSVTANVAADGREAIVTLSNVPEIVRLTVSLINVAGSGADASASVGFLPGDVTGSRRVTAADIAAVKSRSGHTVTNLNFLYDLNVTGASINSTDIGVAKARAGQSMP